MLNLSPFLSIAALSIPPLSPRVWLYTGFLAAVLGVLALDLGVFNRKARTPTAREALAWTGVTVVLALLFAGAVYFMYGHNWLGIADGMAERLAAERSARGPESGTIRFGQSLGTGGLATVEYLTGWILEYSLSLDNIFVIALVFSYFKVPEEQQHRVLFWGVLGALVMRGVMIGAAAGLLETYGKWVLYAFGAILLYSAVKMLLSKESDVHPDRNPAVRLARRLLPISGGFEGDRFLTRLTDGRRAFTPLFLVLVVVETTDVVFAIDSIPAIFSVTKDPFLVFTSNVFAILGLRSLYFALAAIMDKFRYLKVSLVFVLGFIGVKMLLDGLYHIDSVASLVVVLSVLGAGVGASIFASRRERARKRTVAPLQDLVEAVALTRRNTKRVFILIAGSAVILIGVAISPIPGPGGIPVIIGGLMILATEFLWAQRLLKQLKEQSRAVQDRADRAAEKSSPWLIPPVVLAFAAVLLAAHHYLPVRGSLVWTVGAGMALPIGYWAYKSLRAARRGHRPSAQGGGDGQA